MYSADTMIITYHGHSTFKLKGKKGSVVTDPYSDSIGLSLPRLSADIITVSHDHDDHNAIGKVAVSSRRKTPFVITKPGEYEVGGISVFGTSAWHDASEGAERGPNFIFTTLIDGVRVCHLGDLGHELTAAQVEAIGPVDVLLVPVGGVYTIDPALAVKAIRAIEPGIAIPMHYKTEKHEEHVFGELKTVQDFLKEYGVDPTPMTKLDIGIGKIPEETEIIYLLEQ